MIYWNNDQKWGGDGEGIANLMECKNCLIPCYCLLFMQYRLKVKNEMR